VLDFLNPQWIRAASPGDFWFAVCIAWGVGLTGFFAAFYLFRRLRLMEDTPQSLIRSAAQGYVELQGQCKLMPGEPIIAPLTGMRCVWWSYRVEQNGGGRRRWETVKSEQSGELFLVVDETGQCVVDPDRAEVYPTAKQVWYGDTPMPEGGPEMGGFGLGSRYRYMEERMQDGDPLYALGYFHTQGPISAGDIDEEVRAQLAEWKRDQAWLLQHFDANHDGQVDQQEWEAARQEARRLVLEREGDNLKRPPVNVLGRPLDGRDFILSTLPQKKLELRLKIYVGVCLLAFFLAGAAGTRMLSVRYAAHAPGAQTTP
jgi:hypothetical protein